MISILGFGRGTRTASRRSRRRIEWMARHRLECRSMKMSVKFKMNEKLRGRRMIEVAPQKGHIGYKISLSR